MTEFWPKGMDARLNKLHAALDKHYEFQGPTARVYALVLLCPGATCRNVAEAFCETVRYYDKHMLSSYIKQPNRHYSDDRGRDRRGATHWHGTQLSGVLHRMVKQGQLRRIAGIGPRGGFGYWVEEFHGVVPREVLA